MKEKLNVLSLFDGKSCGQVSLRDLGFVIENYYASEIDKADNSIDDGFIFERGDSKPVETQTKITENVEYIEGVEVPEPDINIDDI